MHAQYEQTCNRVPLHNRLEALLEETHIKLSSLVSDLLCTGARRLLKALANGETDPAALDTRRLTPARDPRTVEGCTRRMPRTESCLPSAAEGGAGGAGTDRETDWPPGAGDGRPASPYQDPVERLAEVPGLGVDSAQQVMAPASASAAT